jgi:hypothetical protein
MVLFLTSLWLPVLVAALAVFLASFITHMVLPYHRSDVLKLPVEQEDALLDALRRINATPGDYAVPHAGGPAGMKDPVFVAKATKGPLAFITIAPGSAPSMGPYLGLWFVYCLVVSLCSAYVVWRVVGPDASVRMVFEFAAAITFMAYALALPDDSIWYRRSWITTLKSMFDGVIYACATGAVFTWLWPR